MGALHRKGNAAVTKAAETWCVGRAGNFGLFAGLESGAPYDSMTIERLPLSFVLILQRPSRFFFHR